MRMLKVRLVIFAIIDDIANQPFLNKILILCRQFKG